MKKLLVLLGSIGLTSTATIGVVACGDQSSLAVSKVDLNTLNQDDLVGKENMQPNQAFVDFLVNNQVQYPDLENNVEIADFIVPSYILDGKLVVKAKINSNYVGTATIKITKLAKTSLQTLELNTKLENGVTNQDDAFKAFIALNTRVTDLSDNVEISSFTPPYGRTGTLVVQATTEGKYEGTVKVSIPEVEPINLNTLGLKTSLTNPVTSSQAAFDSFIKLNADIDDLAVNLEVVDYRDNNYEQTGSLVVQAKPNTKYSETLTIIIPEKHKTDLAQLINNTVIEDAVGEVEGLPDGSPAMTADEAFQAFLEVNKSWTNLGDFVEYDASSYQPASFTGGDGFLWINAKSGTAYQGSVKITIKFVVDVTNLKEILRALSFEGLYDFEVPVGTLQTDLIAVLNNEVKQIYLSRYGSFGANIVDINTIGVTEAPTQEQLDTVDTVWTPSRFNYNGGNWSALRLTVDIQYKDGTHETVTVYDVECSIVVVATLQ